VKLIAILTIWRISWITMLNRKLQLFSQQIAIVGATLVDLMNYGRSANDITDSILEGCHSIFEHSSLA